MSTMRADAALRIASLALCVLAWAGVAAAQETINSASVSGRVTDPQHAPVPGATVTARATATNVTAETTTDKDGRFRFPLLKVGAYQIAVRLQGFNDATRDLTLTVSPAFELPISLTLSGVTANVTVKTESMTLEAARSQIAGTVSQAEIKN